MAFIATSMSKSTLRCDLGFRAVKFCAERNKKDCLASCIKEEEITSSGEDESVEKQYIIYINNNSTLANNTFNF